MATKNIFLSFKNLRSDVWIWTIVAITGNPVYNFLAYWLCVELDYKVGTGTNTIQLIWPFFVLILIIIFLVRFFVYKWLFQWPGGVKTNIWAFLSTFVPRHKIQVVGVITFLMWGFSEVEGNVAGFIFVPISLILALVVCPVTFYKIVTMTFINLQFKSPEAEEL